MSGKNTNFNDNKIRKSYFYKNKEIYNIEDIDANKISVTKNMHMVQNMLQNLMKMRPCYLELIIKNF